MEERRPALLGLMTSLWIAASVQAEFLTVTVLETDLALDGTPLADLGLTDFTVFEIYAVFDNPDDQLVGVVGDPQIPFLVETVDAAGNPANIGFHNVAPGLGGSDRPPAEFPLSLNPLLHVDSFFTIGNRILDVGAEWANGDAFTDEMVVAPSTPGPNSDPWPDTVSATINMGWTVPPTLPPPTGGDAIAPPQTLAGNAAAFGSPENHVLIARLAVQPRTVSGQIQVAGQFGVLIIEDGIPSQEAVFFPLPAPGTLALLVLAALAGVRQRRRRR